MGNIGYLKSSAGSRNKIRKNPVLIDEERDLNSAKQYLKILISGK